MNARQIRQIIVMTMQIAQTLLDHTRVPAIPDIAVMDEAAMVCTHLLRPSTYYYFN